MSFSLLGGIQDMSQEGVTAWDGDRWGPHPVSLSPLYDAISCLGGLYKDH